MSIVGYTPVHANDRTGEMFVDPQDIQSAGYDDEAESGFLGFGREARLRRLDRRINRLQGTRSELEDAAPADLYQAAAASGMVQENQFEGLGSAAIVASGTGTLSDTVNRNFWSKGLVLDSDSPADILVTAITVAGLPYQIGTQGAPLSMFTNNSTRFGISFGRKLAMVGQSIVISLSNIDAGSGHNVLGGMVVDELNPYAMAAWMERMLLMAAVASGNSVF